MNDSDFKLLSEDIRKGKRPALIGENLSMEQYHLLLEHLHQGEQDYASCLLSRVCK